MLFVSLQVSAEAIVDEHPTAETSITDVAPIEDQGIDDLGSVQDKDTAASQTDTTEPMSSHYLMQLVIGLIIVVMCIVVLGWFAKRMNRFQSSTDGTLKIIGGISMGARERIVLLRAGDKQILIGVAPGRVNTLHVFDDAIEMDVEPYRTETTSFAERLATMLSGQRASVVDEHTASAGDIRSGAGMDGQAKG